jgi:uridine kinase
MKRPLVVGEIVKRIVEVQLAHPICVAIDGRDGAGKTTLADELVAPLQSTGREVIRASIDGFHNPRILRYARGHKSPEGYFRDSFYFAECKPGRLADIIIDNNDFLNPSIHENQKRLKCPC